MSQTYVGTNLSVSASLPSVNSVVGYEELTFVTGACALWECPPLARAWAKGKEDLVCQTTSFEYKTGATWDEMAVKFSDTPSDAALAIYENLEADFNATGSFKLTLPGSRGVYYFTAQVSKFALFDGGNKEAIQTRSGMLLLQSDPIFDDASNYYDILGVADASSPYVFRISIAEPAIVPTEYKVTVDFLHANHAGRRVIIRGSSVGSAPSSISDTASKINLTNTGVIACDDSTTIGGSSVANGSTQNVFNGTIGSFEIVSNLADLYGDMNITYEGYL